MPEGCQREKWVPLVADVAEILQLQDGSASLDAAGKLWPRVHEPIGDEAGFETLGNDVYVPDASGYKVVLIDE
eukprot:6369251-Lingulodinium_polyedra.AAC.1